MNLCGSFWDGETRGVRMKDVSCDDCFISKVGFSLDLPSYLPGASMMTYLLPSPVIRRPSGGH